MPEMRKLKELIVTKPMDQASQADAEEGFVIIEGPDGMAETMTPEAAEKTGLRLETAAARADEQRNDAAEPHVPSS